ncbi:GNAT family N-acetyltransferase [Roseomonas populi]|uniref:GNAT family N-acetyltransferase n=1 Tax=Roseomonas populi TaxID=3121582 RepID=A0ABT1WYI9_9PROT|nr:GNAT family N-acetyltransferase [Roseomonas pecuniae]MCR0980910.1 GNAT family N-acetyltransferase [Roseomonas pecuniae]
MHPYASPGYAATLAHVGRPVWVEPWNATMLLRDAPGGAVDAAGPHPYGMPGEGAELEAGMAVLRAAGAVSAVMVADPFQGPAPERLRTAFSLVSPFKTHWAVERSAGPFAPGAYHRRYIRFANRRCRVRAAALRDHLDDWCRLYAGLTRRHGISGLHDYPRAAFAVLAEVEGLRGFLAESGEGEVIGMQLWIDDGHVAYSHLVAASEAGYRARAPYALYAAAIEHFAGRDAIDLGGGAGLADDAADGLSAFKRGFANTSRVAHLCGRVLDEAAYARLSAGHAAGGYFPAYRGPRLSAHLPGRCAGPA